MRWMSHKLVTFAGMMTLTHNVGLSVATALCSVFPDSIEFFCKNFTNRRIHRQASHYFVPYLAVAIVSYYFLYNTIGLSPFSFNLSLIFALSLHQIPSVILGYMLLSVSLGSLFHILEDSVCGTVPGLTLKGKRFGKTFFKVNTMEEDFWVFTFCTLTLIPVLFSSILG